MAAPQIEVKQGEVAYVNPATGQIEVFTESAASEGAADIRARGLAQATPEDIDIRQRYLENIQAAAQAKAAAKLGSNVATFGMAGFDSPEDKEQIEAFRKVSPVMSTLTEVAGAALPGLAGGAVAGAALRGIGLAGRAAQVGTVIGEEVAASTAIGAEQALEEGRKIELGDVISGVPLALGMSAAARAAGAMGRTARRFGKAADEVADIAAPEANAISRGASETRARRSVGAAGATDEARVPLTEREVRDVAQNFDEIADNAEKLAGDTFDEVVGLRGTADEVNNISHKRTDYDGKMGDANRGKVARAADKSLESADNIAARFEEAGQAGYAKQIREHIAQIENAYPLINNAPEEMANALDGFKRTLYRGRSKYGTIARQDVRAEGLVSALDDAWKPLKSGLEHEKTWGKVWSEKQTVENAIMSGDRGTIRSGAIWMDEIMDRAPGAAGKDWRGLQEVPVFRARGDVVPHLLGLNDKRFGEFDRALTDWIDGQRQMAQLKTELGVPSVENTPVVKLNSGLDDLQKLRDEVRDMREAMNKRGGKEIRAQVEARAKTRGQLEEVFETVSKLPGGGVLSAGRDVYEKATGKAMFEVPVKPPRAEITRESARALITKRRGARTPGYREPRGGPAAPPPVGGAIPPPGPRRVDDLPGSAASSTGSAPGARKRQAGSASVGAMAGAAGLGLAGLAVSPVTDLLSNLSEDSRAVRERAALGLMAPATRPRPLPSTIERFREGDRSLTESFALKRDELIQALQDPGALLAGLDESFGAIADEHPDLYGGILARAHAAAQYCMAEAPPSVSIGLTRPSGVDPDTLALAKFADIWSGAFNPGDVIYDVGTGDATPTQVRALKDVHPDIYDSLRLDILKQVGEGGSSIPFETLRKLDVLFDIPGIAGPAFSPALSQALQAPAKKPSASAAPSNNAPASATAKFATGPSNMAG